MVFSPPSIVKTALGDSGVLMNDDDQLEPSHSSNQVVTNGGRAHSNAHAASTNYYYYNQIPNTHTNHNNTKMPILDTILKSKGPTHPNTVATKMPKETQHHHHHHQHQTFNPFADENDVPSYHFQLSKLNGTTGPTAGPNCTSGGFEQLHVKHGTFGNGTPAAVVHTSTPTHGASASATAVNSCAAPPQSFTRSFGFNRTNLIWQPSSSSSSGGVSSPVLATSTTALPLQSAGHAGAGSASDVCRFQIRSLSAEQLSSQPPSYGSGQMAAFRPLLPLAMRSLAGSALGGGGGGSEYSPFADENSSSSNYVDDAMTFKSYDLNDEYWLNFE